MRRPLIALLVLAVAVTAAGQITTPPSGDNQKSSVTQFIGPVRVTIDYSSPDVHGGDGQSRRGKIWGQLVPWGFVDEPYGTCSQCPWRAGANENTVITVSHDVEVEGRRLPAGSYGLFMAPGQDEWTLILSKNSTSWGNYTYDPAEDALRVTVKPAQSEYREWLTYDFTERRTDRATVALRWEDLQVPFTISVPEVTTLYMDAIRRDLRGYAGFQWQSWNTAARYALGAKRLDEALAFAQNATAFPYIGQENFTTLSTLADVQEARGMASESKASRDKALAHPTASAAQLHQYARAQLQRGNKAEAVRVWELNAKRYPNQWPVNFGLMRAHSASGRYRDALRYARLALTQAPDEANRKAIEEAIRKLQAGQDAN